MEHTSITLLGATLHDPVNAGTNVLLLVQCVLYWAWLARRPGDRAHLWSLFFQMMAVATAAGVLKHVFRQDLGADAYTLVLATSNVASGFSTFFAQHAVLASEAGTKPGRRALPALQLFGFLAANLLWGPAITLLIVNTAVGLVPVIVAEARAARRGRDGAMQVAAGLSLSILSALAYTGGFTLSPWFNHIDVAHLIVGVSLDVLRRGAGASMGPTAPAPIRVGHASFPTHIRAPREAPWES